MTILDGIPFLPAAHFTRGRESKIDTLVLHWIAGTLASADATFTGGRREASAHFGIENTTVHQYVRVSDTAWHAGDRAVNHRSIGIEHSAAPGRAATPSTIATSVALCVALCRKYGISPARIFPHKKFTATACPGTLPIAAIVAAVRTALTTPTIPEDDMFTDADRSMLQTAYKLLQEQQLRNAPVVAKAVAGLPALTAKAVVAALPVGGASGVPVDVAAIAKAVNDDAAKRLSA